MHGKSEIYAALAVRNAIVEKCDNGLSMINPSLKGVLGFGLSVDECTSDFLATVEQWYMVHTNKGRPVPDLASQVFEANFV